MNLNDNVENYRPLPVRGNHRCFGCSPDNTLGLKMKFFTNEKSLFSWVTVPEHLCGWDTLVHGGIISTILDEIMSWSAITMMKRIILTKSMTIDFIKPVFINTELKAQGNVLEKKSEREALMEGLLYNPAGKLCARSIGTFSLFTPSDAIKVGIMGEAEVKDFEYLFNRLTAA